MIKRLLQVTIASIFMTVLIAIWKWRSIRQKRIPAPEAQSLIANPDTELALSRDGDTLTVHWQYPSKITQIYMTDADSLIEDDAPVATVYEQQMTVLHGIDPTTRYKVMATFDDGRSITQLERELPLLSAPNFRDVGGYHTTDGKIVRWNRIYRSSALDQLSVEDQQKMTDLGIKLVCDVRTSEEHESDPDKLPEGIPVLNIAPSSKNNVWVALLRLLFQEGYLENLVFDLYSNVMVKENPQVFAEIFTRVSDKQYLPMVIHCAAGKDRTGIAVALLLVYLGVPDATIIADYSLSNHHYHFFKESTRKNLAQLRIMGLTDNDFDYLLVADGDALQKTLDAVREEYGSVEGYLLQYVGLSPETLAQVRKNLLI